MKRVFYIFALLLSLALGACQQSDYTYDDTPQGNLDALWTLIDQRYCFLTYKEEQLGFRWSEIHAKYSSKLHPKMSRTQLFEVLCQMLSELKDGHVNISSSIDLGRNWSWKEDYPENLDTELRQNYLGTDYHIGSGLKYTILSDNVAYVVYESFSDAIGEGNLSDMLNLLSLTNGMILDIRGNGGGALTNVEILSKRFTNEKILTGYIMHKDGPEHNDFSAPEAIYLTPSNSIRWQKPVAVLTNRHCYSSANDFVNAIRYCPQVILVGDKTGGGSGLPFSSELPNGWGVRFSTSPHLDANMQQIEFGIEPDVKVNMTEEDKKQGFDTIIEVARKLVTK